MKVDYYHPTMKLQDGNVFNHVWVSLFKGFSHVTTTHDTIGQSNATWDPSCPTPVLSPNRNSPAPYHTPPNHTGNHPSPPMASQNMFTIQGLVRKSSVSFWLMLFGACCVFLVSSTSENFQCQTRIRIFHSIGGIPFILSIHSIHEWEIRSNFPPHQK